MNRYFRDMRLALAGVLLLVCLAAIAVFNLITPSEPVPVSTVGIQTVTAYITTGNIFSGLFIEPFETMALLSRDGTFYTFSTHHDWIIAIPPNYIHARLLKENIEPKDIIIIIHNHLTPGFFSPGDISFYQYFQRRGFRGSFCIYYPFSKHVLMKED